MGLKKNNKVNAQFSMSSLTDIIFLLLIFFMLSSSLVAPNALNLKLPGQSKSKTTQNNAMSEVRVKRTGTYLWNGKNIAFKSLESELRNLSRKPAKERTFTIAPDKKVPVEHVVAVMDAAMRYQLNAILLPEK
jgi:biopolymer transport protein ExbD